MLNEDLGRLHCAFTFIGFNLCFGPQHWLGLNGMPATSRNTTRSSR